MTTKITLGHKDLIPVIVEREGAVMPVWCDTWGIKSVKPDLKAFGGYQWPAPGNIAECDKMRIYANNSGAHPWAPGDGLCVASTWRGMATSVSEARTLLLIAYSSEDVLGRDEDGDKVRVSYAYVAAIVDGERLIRDEGEGANLMGANLSNANLTNGLLNFADLSRSKLDNARLRYADLVGANLAGACIYLTDLDSADMQDANLRNVYCARSMLAYANLTDADLTNAYLRGSDMVGAKLQNANLTCASLEGVNLSGANLSEANLFEASLGNTIGNEMTILPDGYIVKDGYIEREEG